MPVDFKGGPSPRFIQFQVVLVPELDTSPEYMLIYGLDKRGVLWWRRDRWGTYKSTMWKKVDDEDYEQTLMRGR